MSDQTMNEGFQSAIEMSDVERMVPCPHCGKPAQLDGTEDLGARWYVCLDQHMFRVTPDD